MRRQSNLRMVCLLFWAASMLVAGHKEDWARWLKVGADVRGRAEGFTGFGFLPDDNDGYYLHRLRLNATVQPRPWLTFFIQGQDSRALAYNRRPIPTSLANTFDLRQAYLELGHTGNGPWGLRLGRQELSFGEERLIGASNWSNVSRSFDAARLSYRRKWGRLDWFASAVVVPLAGRFDHPVTNNKFYGFYGSFEKGPAHALVEPYLLWKTNSRVKDEGGRWGDLDVYTYGARLVGKLPRKFDYSLEVAGQGGHAGSDAIAAWAGHWVLGYRPWTDQRAPRLVAEYNYASGDGDPRDGRRRTFDQLFPTNHNKYGTADRIAWRNIHDAMAGLEWKPRRKWKWNLDYHAFWLADRQDALYTEQGSVVVRNPQASSSRVGDEIDFQAVYQLSVQMQLGFGCAHLFPGPYLRQSTRGSPVTAPYLMWTYKF